MITLIAKLRDHRKAQVEEGRPVGRLLRSFRQERTMA